MKKIFYLYLAVLFLISQCVFPHRLEALAPSSKVDESEYIDYQCRLAIEEIKQSGKKSFSPEDLPEIQTKYPGDVVWSYQPVGFRFEIRGRSFFAYFADNELKVAREIVAERLLEARAAKKLSQSRLNQQAGLPSGWITRCEAGMVSITDQEHVRRIAEELGVTRGYLMGEGSEKPEEVELLVPRLLKKARFAKGMSQEELAKRIGVEQIMISLWEIKQRRLSDGEMIRKLEVALEVPLGYLTGKVHAEPKTFSPETTAVRDATETEMIMVLEPGLFKAARVKKGLSQRELAEKIGKSPSSVSDWENGLVNISDRETIRLVAGALDVPYQDLVVEEAVKPKKKEPLIAGPSGSPADTAGDVPVEAEILDPKLLKAVRVARGLSQKRFARMIGAGSSTVSDYELGLVRVSDPATIRKLAAALQVPVDCLVAGKGMDPAALQQRLGVPGAGAGRTDMRFDQQDEADRMLRQKREEARAQLRSIKIDRKISRPAGELEEFSIRMSQMMGTDLERTYLSVARNPFFTEHPLALAVFFERRVPLIAADAARMSDREFDAYCMMLLVNAWLVFDNEKYMREARLKQPIDPAVVEMFLADRTMHRDPLNHPPPLELVAALDKAIEGGLSAGVRKANELNAANVARQLAEQSQTVDAEYIEGPSDGELADIESEIGLSDALRRHVDPDLKRDALVNQAP